MKIVTRSGVFETNSSSVHSYTCPIKSERISFKGWARSKADKDKVVNIDFDWYFDTFKLEFQFNDKDEIFIGTVHSFDTSDELEKDEVEYLWIQSLDDKEYFIYWLGDPVIKRQLEEENKKI